MGPLGGPWVCYGGNAQHTALSDATTQDLDHVLWSRPVDLAPQYTGGGSLLIHYGSPVITESNTVVFPVKTGASGGFRFDAVKGDTGVSLWSMPTDYLLPPHDWVPSVAACLVPAGRLYVPGAGGTLLFRDDPDAAVSTTGRVAFFGDTEYATNGAEYDATVFICTPLTPDSQGNVYFGVHATGSNTAGVVSSLVKVTPAGVGTAVPIPTYASDMLKVQQNCAPALSLDESMLYVTVNASDGTGSTPGYVVAVHTSDLGFVSKARLVDPMLWGDALVIDLSSASPTVGPNGDVFVGVLENPLGSNHFRGWLLHFDATLATESASAAFGWDDTPSIVPATSIPSYTGSSSYLLMIKYNDYASVGGSGINRLAVVDPGEDALEPISGVLCMKEVLTVAGLTPDPEFILSHPGAVREWCINTAAVCPATKCIVCNSEDGKCYRWNLVTNTLDQDVTLAPPTGEAYTPTVIGPDGTSYAINNAVLNAIGR